MTSWNSRNFIMLPQCQALFFLKKWASSERGKRSENYSRKQAFCKLCGWITWEFLGFRMQNSHGIIFI